MDIHEFIKEEGVAINKIKGEHLFMQGDADESLYFIQSGLLKAYYTSIDGRESVKSFLLPNDIIGSLSASYSNKRCSFSLVCLEPCHLIQVSFKVLQQHSRDNLAIANAMIDVLLKFAIKKEEREYEFLCLSAEERFRKLIETTPMLLERVTQNDLARYLGITPVGLSRIKKRVLQPF